jgi:hypothetical protein
MKMYEGVDIYINVFLTWALVRGEWPFSRPGRSTTDKRERDTVTPWRGGWVGPGIGLDNVERRKILLLQGLEL